MSIPDYASCMLPLLVALKDGQTLNMKEVDSCIAAHFQLTDEERNRLIPSGQMTYIHNRVGWAKTYLKMAGLVEYPVRGKVRITQIGLDVLRSPPPFIDSKFLSQFPSFTEFNRRQKGVADEINTENTETFETPTETPDEAIHAAYQRIRQALAGELLEQVRKCTPEFFERLVLDVLVAMGYGGTLADAAMHMGRSGDGGIDGIINEDKLGLDMICVQAKRWKDVVGRPVVQAFAGSMEAHRAKKGVIITTSDYSREAKEYVERIERKIVLISGTKLSELMIDHDVGVAASRNYTIKKIDSDYFLDAE